VIVRQNGLSCAIYGASVAETPVVADLVDPGGTWPTTGTGLWSCSLKNSSEFTLGDRPNLT